MRPRKTDTPPKLATNQHSNKLFSIREETLRGKHLVSQPQAERLPGLNRLTGQHQTHSSVMADKPGEIDSGNRWENSQINFWQTKSSILASNNSIAERRQFAAARIAKNFGRAYEKE